MEIHFHESKNHFVQDNRYFRILMSPEVHSAIEKYASSDTSKELGGIILGRQMADGDDRFIVVEGHVEAKFTEAQLGSITFTHQSWNQMHTEREECFPGQKIVGWFHTHPGFGIFLSSYDLFIHKSFFDLPWQLAYVVDPLAGKRGFFRWEGTEIVKAPYKLMRDPEEVVEIIRDTGIPMPTQSISPTVLGVGTKIAVAVTTLLFVASVVLFWITGNLKPQVESAKDSKKISEVVTTEKNEPKNGESKMTLINYRVRQGDTLEGLCWSLLGDTSRVAEVATKNNIINPNIIELGQMINFPSSNK